MGARSPRLILIVAAVLTATTGSAQDRDRQTSHSVSIQAHGSKAQKVDRTAEGTVICPGDVPVGNPAVTFSGEVTTGSESGVSYQVEISYGAGAGKNGDGSLAHDALETNLGTWNVSGGDSETLLSLNVVVTSAQPLQWGAVLLAESPGTVHYTFQTRLLGALRNNESCTFEVVEGAGSIAGTVFLDTDANGERDADDWGLSNFVVYIDANSNQTFDVDVEQSDTTNFAGEYVIEEVEPGEHAVGNAPMDGWEWTIPPDGFQLVNVDQNEREEDVNFGVRPRTGAIGGVKWKDLDLDGNVDADEPRLEGWRIYVDLNNNGTYEANEPSNVTSASGLYGISGLEPGPYVVREVQDRTDYVQTVPDGLGYYTVALREGEIARGRNFSNLLESELPQGAIHGRVYNDHNLNGTQDAGEPGLNGLPVTVTDSSGNVVAEVFTMDMDTNSDGQIDPQTEQGIYWVERLKAGRYKVTLTSSVPYVNTDPTSGEREVTLNEDEQVEGVDFAVSDRAVIAGAKFFDEGERNPAVIWSFDDERKFLDGVFDTAPGVNGVTIEIRDSETGDLVATTTTGGTGDDGMPLGQFSVSVPAPGLYVVQEVLPDGMIQTYPYRTRGLHNVVVVSGDIVSEVNFLNTELFSISGRKFEDVDGDGIRDPDERYIDGWTIEIIDFWTHDVVLYPDRYNPEQKTTTGIDLDGDGVPEPGAYRFDGLYPGVYRITEEVRDGFRATVPKPGPVGSTYMVSLGGDATNLDFGNQLVEGLQIDSETDGSDKDPGDGICGEGDGKRQSCSLRAAIEECNARAADAPPCSLSFNTLGKRDAATIRPQQPLPPITRPMVIDGGGTTVLDGSEAGDDADGLVILGGKTDIDSLTVMGFSGHAIVLADSGSNRIRSSVITGNGGDGIRVSSGTDNLFSQNKIFGNGGRPIDLGGDGPTANDFDESDGWQNYPELLTIGARSDTTIIEGELLSHPLATFVVELFAGSDCDDTQLSGAESILDLAPAFTDSTGRAAFRVELDTILAPGHFIVATASDIDGNTSELSPCNPAVQTASEDLTEDLHPEGVDLPTNFLLHENYPNPFNPSTQITFDLPEASHVQLEVLSALGELVTRLVDGLLPAGNHDTLFNAGNLPSGIYFYRITAGPIVETKKMVLLK